MLGFGSHLPCDLSPASWDGQGGQESVPAFPDGEQSASALRQVVKSLQVTPQGKGEAPGCHVGEFVGLCGDDQH